MKKKFTLEIEAEMKYSILSDETIKGYLWACATDFSQKYGRDMVHLKEKPPSNASEFREIVKFDVKMEELE